MKGLTPNSTKGLLGPKHLCRPRGAFKHLFLPYLLQEWVANIRSKHNTPFAADSPQSAVGFVFKGPPSMQRVSPASNVRTPAN